MPRVQREANVTWEGNVARGSGAITAGTGAFEELPYSLATRIERMDGKTSPEELLAAAHAACFAMSVAGELTSAGTPPEHLDVTATVTLDEVDGSHRIVSSELLTRARVAGIDAAGFERLAQVASEGCTLSKLIEASAKVTVNASLEGGTDGD
ncbi:MAG: OsmC family peroxiredoxin [Actinobacteria bacterium]|nr:OsmC family peroxiredoxin [Actinomycetota bacterium]